MSAGTCENCNKQIETYLNYCSWECQIDLAKKNGGIVHCPNGLPIGCIRYDNLMTECEHGDHKDYKFPVEVEYKGKIPEDLAAWDLSYVNQTHALLYTDGSIVLTISEATYYLWYANDGWGKINKDWRLTDESVLKIKEYFRNKNI